MRIQLEDDDGTPKVKFEESLNYEWNELTASLIAGLIDVYYKDVLKTKVSGEKKESQNNDETNNKVYM